MKSDAYEDYFNYCWRAFCHVLECNRYFGYYQPWGIRYENGEYIPWEEDQFKYQCDCGCECYIVLTRVPRSKTFLEYAWSELFMEVSFYEDEFIDYVNANNFN